MTHKLGIMKTLIILVVFNLVFTTLAQEFRQTYAREIVSFKNYITVRNEDIHLKRGNIIQCVLSCLDFQKCRSVIYNREFLTCILSDSTSHFHFQRQYELGWKTYRIQRDRSTECPTDQGFVYSWELDFCYKYFPNNDEPYDKTIEQCQTFNGTLAGINSPERQKEMEHYLGNYTDGEVRIQGRYNSKVGKWLYKNGEVMTYFNWNTLGDQPNNHDIEVTLIMRKTQQYKWHDVRMDEFYAYVCEIPLD